ncbi:XRE family transcriptional regulator [Nocardia panacis]|uniref:XRE family transcriptional regulator n=1 Tax=Nocardia panacis TaxID=2340916 RepID=A0A3A4KRC5_9NOCA|nr:helix-turn-helix transcriptional regulator [Nocardia panacis]RJO77132.1 XRE family transcriptional regulator [Nocardia panacis]
MTANDDLNDLMGIDMSDPREALAHDLVEADHQMLEKLVDLRKNVVKITASQVAHDIGRNRSVITQFEKLTSDPRLSTIRRYALAIGARITHHVELVNATSRVAEFDETDAADESANHLEEVRTALSRLLEECGAANSTRLDVFLEGVTGRPVLRPGGVQWFQVSSWRTYSAQLTSGAPVYSPNREFNSGVAPHAANSMEVSMEATE